MIILQFLILDVLGICVCFENDIKFLSLCVQITYAILIFLEKIKCIFVCRFLANLAQFGPKPARVPFFFFPFPLTADHHPLLSFPFLSLSQPESLSFPLTLACR